METQPTPCAEALRADMADLQMNPRMLLAAVTPLSEDEPRRGESLELASHLGIEVWVCRSGVELAARVCEAEGLDVETTPEDEAHYEPPPR